jgi:hypothetical protein
MYVNRKKDAQEGADFSFCNVQYLFKKGRVLVATAGLEIEWVFPVKKTGQTSLEE